MITIFNRKELLITYDMKKRIVPSIIIIFCMIAAIVFMGKQKKDEVVIYGVATCADTEGSPQMVINSPRTCQVLIPNVIV